MSSIPKSKAKSTILYKEKDTRSYPSQESPLHHFLFEEVEIFFIPALLEFLAIHRFHSFYWVESLVGAGVSLLVEFPKTAVLFMDEVDEYDAACANDRHACKYHQRHCPSNTYRDGCSACKHGKKVEHASDFLSSCPLIRKRIGVKLRW